MNNKILKLFLLSLIFAITSCQDYLDVNDTPNTALLSQITPNLALSAAQTQTFRVISGDNRTTEADIRTSSLNQFGNVMMNSWAGNVNTTGDPYGSEYRSVMTTSFYEKIWDYSYINIANLSNITKYPSDNYDNHKAIAKILISFYMQNIVDMYGDCPYSQAFLGNANLTPAYDDDKVVYRKLLTNLDEAIALIGASNSADAVVGTEDAMMAGNMDKWVRFANTIKLRLLIRQSGLTDTDTTTYLATELAKLAATNKFLIDDVTINPGYSKTSADAQNPFYGVYGYTISGTATTQRAYVTASRNAATKLNSTSDTRRGRLFSLVSGNVVGIDQGESAIAAPDNVSFIGPAIVPVPTGTSPNLDATIGSSMSAFVMTLSETKFLLAEAAFKYPAIFGTLYPDQATFEDGIIASFVRLKVGTTDANSVIAANTYITANDTRPGFGWTGTADKVEAIMTQKWIALMHVSAHQSWIDYVRTGFPTTPMALNNILGKPKRLMYPQTEISANSANVPYQTSASVFVTGPFWK